MNSNSNNSRKRRRQSCDQCGKRFSYSWYREHKNICEGKILKDNHDSTATIPESPNVYVDDEEESSACDFEENLWSEDINSTDCPNKNCENIETQLPHNITSCFEELLDEKRFEKEDEVFFERSSEEHEEGTKEVPEDYSTESHINNQTEPPATELWDDPDDDKNVEQDFEFIDSKSCEMDDNEKIKTSNSKIETLVLWFMLFLATWQSNYSITDTALAILIKFLCRFFWLVGAFDSTMKTFAKLFPNSHYKLKKALGLLEDDFYKYIVCPKCKSLYKFEDCMDIRSGQKVSARCKFVAWPHHPHRNKRGPCGEFLLKSVRTGTRTILYPRMVFPYNSLIRSIQTLLNKPGFWDKCQEWRKKEIGNLKADIHDGDVWKELASTGFLANVNSLALMLNVDWFRPHKHSPGSVGVLYIVILNLPRHERYKLENVIVVGVLPGPSEPKLTANTFLKPLVDELQALWKATHRFSIYGSLLKRPIKTGLICVACDIPAARKIGGFLGHMANQGCSFCKKNFYVNGKLDFSGFDRDEWPARKSDDHKKDARETLSESTPTSQHNKCSSHGARYSVLHELEYFDCIRFFVVDPMHNLYLGTAKHIMKNIWQSEEFPLIKEEHFKQMQNAVNSMITPQDIGRIPGKIADTCGGFTADQWQNWTVVYSMHALQGILPKNHLDCWQLFVSACKLLGKKTITNEDIELGDKYLLNFLKEVVNLYGPDVVTPNMHLHCHLKTCLYDFGPFHGFWCFSFERYNGILGNYHTNNRSIEIQIMRKFLTDIKAKALKLPEDYCDSLGEFFVDHVRQGSVKLTENPVDAQLNLHKMRTLSLSDIEAADWNDPSYLQALPPIKDDTLDDDDVKYLKQVYAKLLGMSNEDLIEVPFTIAKFDSVNIGPVVYGSLGSRTLRNANIIAKWAGNAGRIQAVGSTNESARPGQVMYYFRQLVRVQSSNRRLADKTYQFYFARVNWYSQHPYRTAYSDHVQIWCNNFDSFGPACFIPIKRIQSRFVAGYGQFKKENVMFVTTLPGD